MSKDRIIVQEQVDVHPSEDMGNEIFKEWIDDETLDHADVEKAELHLRTSCKPGTYRLITVKAIIKTSVPLVLKSERVTEAAETTA